MAYKVYFAARYSRRDELNEYRVRLEGLGIEVTSHWLTNSPPAPISELTEDHWRELAETDRRDIERSDALVAFAESPPGGNGGRHVELGIGIGLGKEIVIVGEPEHLFHRLRNMHGAPDWKTAERLIQKLAGTLTGT
jgi:hypothetical protein